MPDNVTLSAAVRGSLLSLQGTAKLIERTQNRLSTGLEVASAIDDPVSFFQAKTLSDRAFDFSEKLDGIDQGVSTLSTALEAVESIESLVRQLKGIANSLKSATGSQFTDLVTQYNNVRTQVGTLADDATYQGTNLINTSSSSLSVSFSDKTASLLTVSGVNLRQSGLGLGSTNSTGGASAFNYAADTQETFVAGTLITVTYQGSSQTLGTTASIAITYGTFAINVFADSQAGTGGLTITAGNTYTVTLGSTATAAIADSNAATALFASLASDNTADIAANDTAYLTLGVTATMTSQITVLDSALTTLRSNAQTLGSNVALLQTRLDFTTSYINTLEIGAGKLSLADINEEGANLLALQTRQQLGISALAFAGQSEQGILSLFR
tara:strand:- start:86 stop:1237 length:1152 start_codon:yes stop_codon:yes gene_type:complete